MSKEDTLKDVDARVKETLNIIETAKDEIRNLGAKRKDLLVGVLKEKSWIKDQEWVFDISSMRIVANIDLPEFVSFLQLLFRERLEISPKVFLDRHGCNVHISCEGGDLTRLKNYIDQEGLCVDYCPS